MKHIPLPRKNHLILAIVILLAIPLIAHYCITQTGLLAFVKSQRTIILHFVQLHYLKSVLIFMGTYIGITALSVPEAAILTTTAGFLFGATTGALYVVIAATLGATIAFIIIRFFIGHKIQSRYEVHLAPFNDAFEKKGSWYLLLVHLIPGVPFVLINMLAALTKVSLFTFIWTTLIGIIPGTFMYTFLGEQLRKVKTASFSNKTYLVAVIGFLIAMLLVRLIILKIARSYKLHQPTDTKHSGKSDIS